jgi:hypothetical protein
MKENLQKASRFVAVAWPALLGLAAITCLTLAAIRIFYDLSLRQPFQIFTSGLEEEALFSVWKYVHGQPVYSDLFSIPFSGSYFNWLFYVYRVGPFKTHSYQGGGLEGLIDQRYFKMIIIPKQRPDPDWIDLTGRYHLQAEDEFFKCYMPDSTNANAEKPKP